MIYDVREYTCRPNTLKKQLALYQQYGFAVQSRHLGRPLCFLAPDVGPVNTYLHIWVYADAADRDRKRAALAADPDWHAYQAASAAADNLVSQENRLMTDAPFMVTDVAKAP
ncbi:NIPSNAP family protein [Novispirillum itersonii]|uniref:NIPSNAP family protein n=1 Tax=Novispirillum itersonii TaxID=189 RepID=UPI000367F46D|nr:NIPSNAP family protein [Novispirillum itersonii]